MKWDTREGFYVVPIMLRPQSVGTIRLRSSNPFEYPILQPNYLTAKEDMLVIYRGIKKPIHIYDLVTGITYYYPNIPPNVYYIYLFIY